MGRQIQINATRNDIHTLVEMVAKEYPDLCRFSLEIPAPWKGRILLHSYKDELPKSGICYFTLKKVYDQVTEQLQIYPASGPGDLLYAYAHQSVEIDANMFRHSDSLITGSFIERSARIYAYSERTEVIDKLYACFVKHAKKITVHYKHVDPQIDKCVYYTFPEAEKLIQDYLREKSQGIHHHYRLLVTQGFPEDYNKKINSTIVTEYTLHGKNVVHLTQSTDNVVTDTLHFYYDAQGKPAIVIYDGTAYGYLYNLQGDVVALVDGTGTKVVEYTYDAWGKPTGKMGTMASTLGTVQPFRYRGYVFDEETGNYYLRSRYYRPE